MKKILRILKIAAAALLAILIAYLLIICFPQPFFRYKVGFENLTLYSDLPIPTEGISILKEAQARLSKSVIYNPKDAYRVFICNNKYKFMFFANTNYRVGGINYSFFNRNSFLRKSEIGHNRLIGPSGKEVGGERTLVYFMTHEIVHGITAKKLGRVAYYKLPVWIREGYADYIAKGEFDFKDNLKKFKARHSSLDPQKSGLYLRYHLLVAYQLDIRGLKTDELLYNPREQKQLEEEISKYDF